MLIQLRPRQQEMVTKAIEALKENGNTLCVAPTGAGKTIIMADIIGNLIQEGQKALVLQHRHELLKQNSEKFKLVNPQPSIGTFNALEKSFEEQVTFAMVQTLAREEHLEKLPHFDVVAIDECHHAAAKSYLKIITALKNINPSIKVLGLTATPNRGDNIGLIDIFNNVADQIYLGELIEEGTLVPPRTYAIDLGCQSDLATLYGRNYTRKGERKELAARTEIVMEEASRILNTDHYCNEVVRHWISRAKGRKSVIFCTTIKHAQRLQQAFLNRGILAAHVNGKMSFEERERCLKEFTEGNTEVMINVAVLTEGWDFPPASCVILLRPTSYKSTMLQMIGRGLRSSEGKGDCLVLDFGMSSQIHGQLEQVVDLEPKERNKLYQTKKCPSCKNAIPRNAKECALCGFAFSEEDNEEIREIKGNLFYKNVVLKELDILNQSQFKWATLDQNTIVASVFDFYVVIKRVEEGSYVALGGHINSPLKLLKKGPKALCLYSADNFLFDKNRKNHAKKDSEWMILPPTGKQLSKIKELSGKEEGEISTRYEAATLLTYLFQQKKIDQCLKKGERK